MNSKRPVDKGSSPATRKKARRSIMKTVTMASGVRGDENIRFDAVCNFISPVSFELIDCKPHKQ